MYASPNTFMVMRWAGHEALVREVRNVYSILVGKSERKRALGKNRSR
jgi:hypothetical protein